MFRLAAAAMIALIAAAGALASQAHAGAPAGTRFTEQQILDAAHGATPKVYAGAYSETLSGESLYYVNSVSTQMPGYNGAWVELCSDDAAEAAGWAAVSNGSGNGRTLQGQRETRKFFEFRYADGDWAVLMRVHKCSFARPEADLFAGPPRQWGRYNATMASKAVREFTEYGWFIQNYDLIGSALMASERAQGPGYDGWALYYTSLEAGGFGMCEQVSLHKLTTKVHRGSRAVTMSDDVVDTVQGTCH